MGMKLGRKTFGGSGSDYGFSVQQTSDGGYIIAGFTGSYGAGNTDVYLIRLDSEGVVNPVEITLTPAALPIIIPASGGSFDFNIEVLNVGTVTVNFDVGRILPNQMATFTVRLSAP